MGWNAIQRRSMWFDIPTSYYGEALAKDSTSYRTVDGAVQVRASACWFTNIDHGRRHEPVQLMTVKDNIRFSKHPEVRGVGYKRYDNYDAIEVPFIDAIPSDYDGLMGVPITFLDKYNPHQFEIVGTLESSDPDNPGRTRWYSAQDQKDAYLRRFGKPGNIPLNMSGVIDDVKVFKRIVIRTKAN